MKLRFGILSAMLALTGGIALGQAVAVFKDGDELLMGHTAALQVSVSIPSDTASVEFPLLREAAARNRRYVTFAGDSVEMLVAHKKALDVDDGRYSMRYELAVQAFDSGRYELPPLEFMVDGRPVASNSVELSVLPVKAKADDKIDDFTGVAQPFELNPNPEDMVEAESAVLIWWIVAVAVLLLVAAAGFFLYKKNGRIFPGGRVPLPYEVALDKLAKLRRQNLPERGKTKEYYTRLSDVLRVYLRKQFGIKTYEKTSAEILRQVEDDETLSRYAGVLRSIFETSDFVKFAKVNPSDVENSRCMSDAVRFVETSRPSQEEDVQNPDRKKGGES